jgi:hypothetical protein
MTNDQFLLELEHSFNRSKEILMKKEKEYSQGKDRLEQFHRAGAAQAISPPEALIGMATKHYTSICDMAKDANNYTIEQWDEKISDLRNYTFLLDALIRDIRS